MSGIERVPGDGSEVSRVQVGPRVNQLLEAGMRNRYYLRTGARATGGSALPPEKVGAVDILGNVNILSNVEILGSPEAHITGGRDMMPLTNPLMREMPRPLFRPMVRLMGQTTIEQRRWGNRSLWQDTPIEKVLPASVGALDVTYDMGDLLAGVESLGWEWDFKADILKAYVRTSRGLTTVTIPGAKVKAIFMRAYKEAYGMVAPRRFQQKATCGDLFSDIGNFFTKEIPKAVKNVGSGLSSFAKDPSKWIKGAARDIGKVAKDVVNNVVSNEAFAGVMAAISVIPPLTAVGGLGLAAYGVAKTAKMVLQTAKAVTSTKPAPKALPPKPFDPKAYSAGQKAGQAAARAASMSAGPSRTMVAKIGQRQVPVTVVSKAKPKVQTKTVSKQSEAKITSAVEQLQARILQLSQQNTPYARLLIAGFQTVSV